MALFVYTTQRCEEDICHHAMQNDVDRFRERLLKEQRTNIFDNFPPPYMKKRFTRQLRLIANQYPFGEHLVVVFLRVLVRGQREYRAFIDDPRGYGDQHLGTLVDKEDLRNWLNVQLRKNPPPERETPNDVEKRYLWNVLGRGGVDGNDIFICESEDWVQSVSSEKMLNQLVLLIDPLLEASEHGADEQGIIPVPGRPGIKVIGRHFPGHGKLFLAGVSRDASEAEVSKIRDRYRAILEAPAADISEEVLLQYSARSYPRLLLVDEDLWLNIEKDETSNLALSPEETSILESVHTSGFPLFINGRAGSGKSTILQYLFADYLRVYLTSPSGVSGPPLYFATSGELLQRSRDVVGRLLSCGHKYALQRSLSESTPEENGKTNSALDQCFHTLHEFFLSHFTRDGITERFSPDRHVDYARFKRLWNDKFGQDPKARKVFGPDVSWHVLRSYIKGLSVDGYLEPEEYAEQPERERTVTQEAFELVHDRVWKNWYRGLCEQEGYWDDQDLARALLDHDRAKAMYPAIFCDEAQDLTRLELEILFRLSLFSERRLTSQELKRVPFAFAGDPFQTLNPTGFRWDAIKSAFVLKFLRSLDPSCRSGVTDINYQELSYNYRSTKNIVRLCNGIQALRAALFDVPGLKPQTTWKYEESSPMPVWFSRDKGEVRDQLKRQSDLTIIVPCLEGEEKEYVDNDEVLSSIVRKDETGVPQNVLSATRAKGLEFSRVALWCFGLDENARWILDALGDESARGRKPEERLPREYFINRLYVAASRPRRRLIVIESEEGMKHLWSFATEPDVQDLVLERLRPKHQIWKENIGTLQPGVGESWSSDREDPEVLAEKFEKEGHAKRDSYLLRTAAMFYETLEDNFRALQCRGFALHFEGEYKKAGDTFKESNDPEKALSSYWIGGAYGAIVELTRDSPEIGDRLECRVAVFLNSSPSLETGGEILKQVKEKLEDSDFVQEVSSTASWGLAIERVCKSLAELQDVESNNLQWKGIAGLAEAINRSGLGVSPRIRGRLHYRAWEWKKAIECWIDTEMAGSAEFRDAKARVLLQELEADPQRDLTGDELRELADYYLRNKIYRRALDYWGRAGDPRKLLEVSSGALSNGEVETAWEGLHRWIELTVRFGDWPTVSQLLQQRIPDTIKDKKLRELLIEDMDQAVASTLLHLSRSELLPTSDAKSQREISDLLSQLLIHDVSSWTRHTTPDVAGAAIERAGRDISALEFYENVIEGSVFSREQKERAKKRWLRTKLRQARREGERGKRGVSQRHDREAKEKARAWKVPQVEMLPEFPDLTGLTDPKQTPALSAPTPFKPASTEYRPPDSLPNEQDMKEQGSEPTNGPVVWTVGNLSFRFIRQAERINIENTSTGDTASIRISEARCVSNDVEFTAIGRKEKTFRCKSWNLECDFSRLRDGRITLRFVDTDMDVRLRLH